MDINNKYHNGKIYQITDIGYNKYYIGSTTEELSQRMARHRRGYKSFLNGNKNFIRSFDLFNERFRYVALSRSTTIENINILI